MPDFRDRWLFVAGVEMNWLVIPRVLQRELFALVRQVGGWTEGTTPSKVHAVCRTAREAAAGKRVAFAGVDGTLAYNTPTGGTQGAQEPREEPFTRDEGEEPERATERRSWRRMLDV